MLHCYTELQVVFTKNRPSLIGKPENLKRLHLFPNAFLVPTAQKNPKFCFPIGFAS